MVLQKTRHSDRSVLSSDRQLNEITLSRLVPDWDKEVKDPVGDFLLSEDPMTKRVVRLFDARVTSKVDLPDMPIATQRSNTTTLSELGLVTVNPEQHEEICMSCNEGRLTSTRAVEVGHTFYLGSKYSSPLGANYTPKNGTKQVPIEMGCYGIGVSRLLGAIAEKTRDSKGLSWPISIAPYSVVIVIKPPSANAIESAEQDQIELTAVKLFHALQDRHGIDALIDDRKEKSFGWKLQDAKYLGFPICIIVGNKFLSEGKFDIELRRTGESYVATSLDDATDTIRSLVLTERSHKWA